MRSIKFPKMFTKNTTNVWKASEHKAATMQSTILLLHSERGELFGDPYFGLMFKHFLFDQNSIILEDALIDIIYTQLALFIPQLKIDRNNIDIIRDQEKGKLYCNFLGTDQVDYTINTYKILLFDMENNI